MEGELQELKELVAQLRADNERLRQERASESQGVSVGCSLSYVALQEAFFSLRQKEGEKLLEFSLALMSLLEKVKQQLPNVVNAETLLHDQFVEYVNNNTLRRELKQLVRRQPNSTLLEVKSEAFRWEQEGDAGGCEGPKLIGPSGTWNSVWRSRRFMGGGS